jgi:hypothetical protein
MYMGGMSYFSKGFFWRGFQVGASWADAAESAISRATQVRKLLLKTLIGH